MKFSIGEPVPWFAADTHSTPGFQFSAAAGRLVILSFVGSLGQPALASLVREIAHCRAAFDDQRLCFFGVSADPEDFSSGRAVEALPGVRWFRDFGYALSRLYGASIEKEGVAPSYQPFSLLLDERLRVLAVLRLEAGDEPHVGRLLEVAAAVPAPEDAQAAARQAPVLFVSRVFEPEFCRMLIEYYRMRGGEESGYMHDQHGRTVGVHNYGMKRRRDCIIEDAAIREQCALRIQRRLVPEIQRAYQFSATQIERYIVACYRGEQAGHFRPHRDNIGVATAHRRFAVSLNLNDDYEGGFVRFPEYGNRLFRPGTGEAAVFSCSLLHEATPVTRGERFVFLPFLYDDAAARVREQTTRYLGSDGDTGR